MQSDKLSEISGNQLKNLSLLAKAPGVSSLRHETSNHSLNQFKIPTGSPSGIKDAVDVVFQSLLSDANDELAQLLRDVGARPEAAQVGPDQNRSVSDLLMRAIRCAAKQYMLQAHLGSLALTDELTNLYNRRSFLALAERQLKLVRRSRRGLLLFFADVDGLKRINDSFGHAEGDLTLKRAAAVLQHAFRDSDIIARLGGDEFAVLAIEASGRNEATIRTRLRKYLDAFNSQEPRYAISLAVGVVRLDNGQPTSVMDLLAQADKAMYEEKRNRSKPRLVAEAGCPS
jgi:diguanylate cyclase (GGDEF)-like protein